RKPTGATLADVGQPPGVGAEVRLAHPVEAGARIVVDDHHLLALALGDERDMTGVGTESDAPLEQAVVRGELLAFDHHYRPPASRWAAYASRVESGPKTRPVWSSASYVGRCTPSTTTNAPFSWTPEA